MATQPIGDKEGAMLFLSEITILVFSVGLADL